MADVKVVVHRVRGEGHWAQGASHCGVWQDSGGKGTLGSVIRQALEHIAGVKG